MQVKTVSTQIEQAEAKWYVCPVGVGCQKQEVCERKGIAIGGTLRIEPAGRTCFQFVRAGKIIPRLQRAQLRITQSHVQ